MKIRQGFVSNSSSASFVIKWKPVNGEKDLTINGALSQLFCIPYDEKTDSFGEWKYDGKSNSFFPFGDDAHCNEDLSIVEMSKNTAKNGRVFTTSFFTAMMNDTRDFGDAANQLLAALVIYSKNNSYKYKFTIDDDNGEFSI